MPPLHLSRRRCLAHEGLECAAKVVGQVDLAELRVIVGDVDLLAGRDDGTLGYRVELCLEREAVLAQRRERFSPDEELPGEQKSVSAGLPSSRLSPPLPRRTVSGYLV